MSMVGEFQRLSESTLDALKQDPEQLEALPWLWWFMDLDEPERTLQCYRTRYDSEEEAQAALARRPAWSTDLPLSFSLDKDWHVMHYLLTGRVHGGRVPLKNAVLGGTPIGPDDDFGPARYLEPREVAAVARALEEIDRSSLFRHWPPGFLSRWRLYSAGGVHEDGLYGAFTKLRDYYRSAHANDEAMILKVT